MQLYWHVLCLSFILTRTPAYRPLIDITIKRMIKKCHFCLRRQYKAENRLPIAKYIYFVLLGSVSEITHISFRSEEQQILRLEVTEKLGLFSAVMLPVENHGKISSEYFIISRKIYLRNTGASFQTSRFRIVEDLSFSFLFSYAKWKHESPVKCMYTTRDKILSGMYYTRWNKVRTCF